MKKLMRSAVGWFALSTSLLLLACGDDDDGGSADTRDTADTTTEETSPDTAVEETGADTTVEDTVADTAVEETVADTTEDTPNDTGEDPVADCLMMIEATGGACDAEASTCTLPGAAMTDEAGALDAGALLLACGSVLEGYQIDLSGWYVITKELRLPPGTSLIGAQALMLDDSGRPQLSQLQDGVEVPCEPGDDNPCECGWGWERPEGYEDCAPVLADGAVPTVIEPRDLCEFGLEDAEGDPDELWGLCGFFAQAIVVRDGGRLSRFTVTQGGQDWDLPSEEECPSDEEEPETPFVRGFVAAGSDVSVSELDIVGNANGGLVEPCTADALVWPDDDSNPRCANPSSTNVRVQASVFRYNVGYQAGSKTDVGLDSIDGSHMELRYEDNVIIASLSWYGLWFRAFATAADNTVDVATRNNWIWGQPGEGISLGSLHGGLRNTFTLRSDGDYVEENGSAIEIFAGSSDPFGDPAVDNQTEAWVTNAFVGEHLYGYIRVGDANDPSGESRNNRTLVHLEGNEVHGYLECFSNELTGDSGLVEGSSDEILAANDFDTAYIPAFCTTSDEDVPITFISEWLLLGMYRNLGGGAPGEDAFTYDYLADGTTTAATIVPEEGLTLGLPGNAGDMCRIWTEVDIGCGEFEYEPSIIACDGPPDADQIAVHAFDGPGELPTVSRIAAASPADGTVDINAWFDERCWQEPASEDDDWLYLCAEHGLDDVWEYPPANAAAYLFVYVENLSGEPLPYQLGVGSDDGIAVTVRPLDVEGEPEPVIVVDLDRAAGGPGWIQDYSEEKRLPVGTSLITALVAEGGGDWKARLTLLQPGTLTALDDLGLVSYRVTRADPNDPLELIPLTDLTPEGIAAGTGDTFFAADFSDGRIVVGDVRTGAVNELVPAQGRSAAGMHYDARTGLLWVAGFRSGVGVVYDASTGAEVESYALVAEGDGIVNDVVVTETAAYFTDSQRAYLYRVALDADGRPPEEFEEIALESPYSGESGACTVGPGLIGNGIVASDDGAYLMLVHMSRGELFRMDVSDHSLELVTVTGSDDSGGAALCAADGLLLDGSHLYVVQNFLDRVAVLTLSEDRLSATVDDYLTHPSMIVPTTIMDMGEFIYAVTAGFAPPDEDYLVRLPKP